MAGFDDVGIGDSVLLENITTDAFLDNLKVRGHGCLHSQHMRELRQRSPLLISDIREGRRRTLRITRTATPDERVRMQMRAKCVAVRLRCLLRTAQVMARVAREGGRILV
ncbi:hypothetical protein MRX96_049758 [Rhipicephalus microplus]